MNDVVIRARGRELLGNFNPLVIPELFWEQSLNWHLFARAHVDEVSGVCRRFLESVLKDKGPSDIFPRLWPRISETIKARHRNAMDELEKILNDTRSYVINYNHYYTDTIKKRQAKRRKHQLSECLEKATQLKKLPGCQSDHTFPSINVDNALGLFAGHIDPDMDNHSSEEVLDCLLAIYKVPSQCGQARGGDYVLCSVLCTVYSPLLNPNPAKLNMQEDSRQPITGGEMRIIRMAIGPSGLTFAALMTFVFRLSPRSFQVLFMK